MKYTRNDIIKKLEAYPSMREKIALLRYELEHPATISPDEMIQAMAFSHEDGIGRPTNSISNKTMYIAMNYQTEAARQLSGAMDEIVSKLVPLEREVDRLDYYLSFVEQRAAAVIRLYYFQHKSWDSIARELEMSRRSAQNIRNAAVDKLAEMYSFADDHH